MTLFTNTSFRNSAPKPQATTRTTPSKLPPNVAIPRVPGLGYILFPSPKARPWSPDIPPDTNSSDAAAASEHDNEPDVRGDDKPDTTSEKGFVDTLAQKRRELEAEEARKGEEDWVRSGGILRDAEGRRDWARTQAIREELRLRELEKQIQERWEKYERRWNNIWTRLKSGGSENAVVLRFEDIPWPIREEKGCPTQVGDLTVKRVEEFLLEGLIVRGAKVTKKDRVRSSLLRWHPDKLGNLLVRIHPNDVENIRQGLGIVMECLQELNA